MDLETSLTGMKGVMHSRNDELIILITAQITC